MRRFTQMLALFVMLPSVVAMGQTTLERPVGQYQLEGKDSGVRMNLANQDSVVYSTSVKEPDAAWIRLYFGAIELDKGSYILVTSLKDGEVQKLDASTLAMWNYTSAYFNGDEVKVELVAGARTQRNRLVVDQFAYEKAHLPVGDPGVCGICSGDSRVPSSENWAGRLMPIGCTASVWNTDSCLVSAGHCMQAGLTIQFNVPNSSAGCFLNNPPVADQFPIVTFDSQNAGVGADWAVMTSGTNNLGQTIFDRYGLMRPIAASTAANGSTVSTFGYGGDTTCTLTQTQQTSTGTVVGVFSTSYDWTIDTTGGTSGSAAIQNGEIVGIVTHCGCGVGFPSNSGSRMDIPAFAAARNAVCAGGGAGNNDDCTSALSLSDGVTAFDTSTATTDGPDYAGSPDCGPSGDDNVHNDIWYDYTASCTGDLTVTTCEQLGGSANYDTRLAIHNGCGETPTCPAGAAIACNDDDPINACGTGGGGFKSTLTVPVQQGNCYKIRVGGFGAGDFGTGNLNVTCAGVGCGGPGDCDDGNPCTDDVCTATVCSNPPNNDPCEDGNLCTVNDTCSGGSCQSGPPMDCDDSNVCTVDSCSAGSCVNAPTAGSCDDGDLCTLSDTCSGGSCQSGPPMDCDDANDCTDDSCLAGSCVNAPNTALCDDGIFCNGVESCSGGSCVTSGDPCPGQGCDEFAQTCVDGGEVSVSLLSQTVMPGGTLGVELFVTDVMDVRSYQAGIVVTRTSGTGSLDVLCPGGVTVDDSRPDWIFAGETDVFPKVNCSLVTLISVLGFGSSVNVGATPAYLGEFELTLSADAAIGSTFEISLSPFPGTVFLNPLNEGVPVSINSTMTVTVGPPTTTEITCVLANDQVAAGSSVDLEVKLTDATNLRAYQTTVQIVRTSGTGTVSVICPDGVEVDESRPDWVFAGETAFTAANCIEQSALGAMAVGGIDVGLVPEYLSGYRLNVSPDAAVGSTFEISLVPLPITVLTAPANVLIPYNLGPPCTLTVVPAGTMSCSLSSSSAPPNGTVDLDVFLSEVQDLRGYQTDIQITRTSGTGSVLVNCPNGVEVDETRPDWVFAGAGAAFSTVDCANLASASALVSGTVNVGLIPEYLSEYHLTVSSDATVGSTFEISILPPPDSELVSGPSDAIPFATGPVCVLTVEPSTLMTCQLSSNTGAAGGTVSVDLFVEDVDALRAFQTRISVVRTSGTGSVTVPCPGGVDIDESRADYVFDGAGTTFVAFDCPDQEAASALGTGMVNVPPATPRYMSTYTLDISADTMTGSTFEISIDAEPDSALVEFPSMASIPFAVGPPCVLTVDVCQVVLYGDVDRDGDVDVFDVTCVLDAFSGSLFCGLVNVDIAGFLGSCTPDGMVDVFDVTNILDAFSGISFCPDPCLP